MNYDFGVPSLVINNQRALIHDSDYASLGIVTLAPDGTQLKTYGPVSKFLGDHGKGAVTVGLGFTDIDVPDGGSMGVVFTVINKGHGSGTTTDALNVLCAGIVGALASGQLAGVSLTYSATGTGVYDTFIASAVAIPAWEAAVGIAVGLAVLEALHLILANCDGVVVPGTIQFGRGTLDEVASQGPWDVTVRYPGSESPEGCGANSDYQVDYRVIASSAKVEVPNVIGQDPDTALNTLSGLGLNGVIREEPSDDYEDSRITDQHPGAGAIVYRGTTITLIRLRPREGPPR